MRQLSTTGSASSTAGLGQIERRCRPAGRRDRQGRPTAPRGQVADGAGQLADGLGDAADGSGQLADGLGQAADGAPKLVDGAQRLSDEGTKKLVEAGEATAQNYGEMYAMIEAGAERAHGREDGVRRPRGRGRPDRVQLHIKGEDGEGGRNLARGVGGLAVLAAGAGAFALRRRLDLRPAQYQ